LAGETLKATLVWTDPPGDSLQNDLDLIVTTPDGRELHGNVAPDAAGFDRSNNVEQVVVPNIAAGIATVTVRAFRNVSPQSYCGGADLVAAQKDLRLAHRQAFPDRARFSWDQRFFAIFILTSFPRTSFGPSQ
jgi:hypothetical protein